jgi:hypothetical protein
LKAVASCTASQLTVATNCQNGCCDLSVQPEWLVTFQSSQTGWLSFNPARIVGYLSIQPEWLVIFQSRQNGWLPLNPARMVGYLSIQPEWLVTFQSRQNSWLPFNPARMVGYLSIQKNGWIPFCAVKAIFYCPSMNSHRPRSQDTAKERTLIPEKDSKRKRPRSHVCLEKSSKIYKPLEK